MQKIIMVSHDFCSDVVSMPSAHTFPTGILLPRRYFYPPPHHLPPTWAERAGRKKRMREGPGGPLGGLRTHKHPSQVCNSARSRAVSLS